MISLQNWSLARSHLRGDSISTFLHLFVNPGLWRRPLVIPRWANGYCGDLRSLHFGRETAESFARDSKYLEIVEGHKAREEFQILTRRGKRDQLVDLGHMVKNVEAELEEAEEEVVNAFKEMQMGMRFCRNWIYEVHRK